MGQCCSEFEAQRREVAQSCFTLSRSIGGLQVRSELFSLRDHLIAWQHARDEGDEKGRLAYENNLRARYETFTTVYVSDMSGFSRIVKEEGIIHFLALVKEMQAICLPIIEGRGGTLVKTVADNLFVTFNSAVAAVMAASECMQAVKKFSEGKRDNDKIKLSIGISQGLTWVIPGCDCFGGVTDVAFKLGEDISEKEILVTKETVHALKAHNKERWQFAMRNEKIGGRKYRVAAVTDLQEGTGFPYDSERMVIHPPINAEEPEFLSEMLMQYRATNRKKKRLEINGRLHSRFFQKRAVLVINMEGQAEYAEEHGMFEYMHVVLTMTALCENAVEKHGGMHVKSVQTKLVAQEFALFYNVRSALEAAITAFKSARKLGLQGDLMCAIAAGEVLDLDSANCFGDAVNMAFKLAEDTAKPREMLVTEDIFGEVQQMGLPAENRSVTLSNVTIKHKNVLWEEVSESMLSNESTSSDSNSRDNEPLLIGGPGRFGARAKGSVRPQEDESS